ncbi:MAG TPA: cytochrome c oxidase assembly protein [Streptosporangiaceae bacterium]|nr:cytochrome c oxidase assembly protein [Streptosporangiaceae bacterium]
MNMVVSHWSANAAVLAGCLVVAAVHLAGLRGLLTDARRGGAPLPRGLAREAIAFYCGLLAVLLALVSPLGYWAGTFIWVRVLQDILLGVVAPPLIVLGAPWLVLWRGLGRARHQDGSAVAGTESAGVVQPRWLSWPVAVTALFVLVWCGWYVPALYDAGLHHPLVLAAQAISYLGVGVLFWLQLIGSRPLRPRFGPLHRVMLIAATVLCSTILGMVLGFAANVIYPAYRGVGSHHLLTVAGDQQLGGAELWVLVLLPYVIAGVALLVRWLNDEESQALTLGLDRMLRPPKSAWPTRTGWR